MDIRLKPRLAILCLCGFVLFLGQARASFTSVYAFGDGLTTTTDNSFIGPDYFGARYCNGRVWIEVLCQWQGISYQAAKNNSYFGHSSQELLGSVNAFAAPSDAGTSLFVVWCASADFIDYIFKIAPQPPYTAANIPAWTSYIDASIARYQTALTTLYQKGMRRLIMPNSANASRVPFFGFEEFNKEFVNARTIDFNLKLKNMLAAFRVGRSDLVIYEPDVYSLFENARLNPSAFGLVHNGVDAITALVNPSLDGPGSQYLFWDDLHPTSKFQMYIADLAQQLISPARVMGVTFSGASGQLQVGNIPLGRQGIVQTSANLLPPWTQASSFTEPESFTRLVPVSASGPAGFYRVSFPVVWTWP